MSASIPILSIGFVLSGAHSGSGIFGIMSRHAWSMPIAGGPSPALPSAGTPILRDR